MSSIYSQCQLIQLLKFHPFTNVQGSFQPWPSSFTIFILIEILTDARVENLQKSRILYMHFTETSVTIPSGLITNVLFE